MIKVEVQHTMNSPYPVLHFIVNMTEEYTMYAIKEMSEEVGRKIASEVFKKHKKKIMDGVNIDLVVKEVETNLLKKIKKHQENEKTNDIEGGSSEGGKE